MNIRALLRAAGAPDADHEPLHGGDMGSVVRAGEVVVKSHPSPPPGLFEAEARGLATLRAAGVRVPEVLHVESSGLVLRYLAPGPPDGAAMGRLIAGLHQERSHAYGSDEEVFLGRFRLPSGRSEDGQAHWRVSRVEPLLRSTWSALGPVGPQVEAALRFTPPLEGPRLLHGDLWSGNALHTSRGPALIDPSVWWGERAVDLAMMRLFGGFSRECWRAYREVAPIPTEVEQAIDWWQLYFLLVHVYFFGGSYVSAVRELCARYR